MINQLPDLEAEDKRYNLHVGADAPATYNLTLVYPNWVKPTPMPPLMKTTEVKSYLDILGIKF